MILEHQHVAIPGSLCRTHHWICQEPRQHLFGTARIRARHNPLRIPLDDLLAVDVVVAFQSTFGADVDAAQSFHNVVEQGFSSVSGTAGKSENAWGRRIRRPTRFGARDSSTETVNLLLRRSLLTR